MAARVKAAIGFRAHTGWAAAVSIGLAGNAPTVLDRRTVELCRAALPVEVYHVASSRKHDDARTLIARAERSARSLAKREVTEIVSELAARGIDVVSAGVVLGSGRLTLPLDAALRSHAGSHAAEGELYRQAVMHGSEAVGLAVTAIADGELYELCAATLGVSVERLKAQINELGAGLGPPWRQDQKSAALVAWLALRQRGRR